MILIQAIGIRFVLPPRARAVYQHGIGSGGAANRNTIHRMCLAVGPRNVTLPFTMEVTNPRKVETKFVCHAQHRVREEMGKPVYPQTFQDSVHHSGGV